MWRTYFTVMFYSRNGVWIELPRTESITVVQELVCSLLKCIEGEGEALRVLVTRERTEH